MISASSTNRARWSSLPGVARLNLLDGDVALQLGITRQPDLPDSALGMRADQLKPLVLRAGGSLRTQERLKRESQVLLAVHLLVHRNGRLAPRTSCSPASSRIPVVHLGQHVVGERFEHPAPAGSGEDRLDASSDGPPPGTRALETARHRGPVAALSASASGSLATSGPGLQYRGKTRTGNGVRQHRQHGDQKIAIQLVHKNPLRPPAPRRQEQQSQYSLRISSSWSSYHCNSSAADTAITACLTLNSRQSSCIIAYFRPSRPVKSDRPARSLSRRAHGL